MNTIEPYPYILTRGFTVNSGCRFPGVTPGGPAPEIDENVRPSTVPQKDELSRLSTAACSLAHSGLGNRISTRRGIL